MKRVTTKRKRLGSILIALCLITLLLFLSVGKRGFIQQIRVNQEKKRLIREIESLKEKKKQLEEEKEKLNDPEHIEKIAREEYGMAKKNEKVYRVIPKQKE